MSSFSPFPTKTCGTKALCHMVPLDLCAHISMSHRPRNLGDSMECLVLTALGRTLEEKPIGRCVGQRPDRELVRVVWTWLYSSFDFGRL